MKKDFLHRHDIKQFLKRNPLKVNQNYLYDTEELVQLKVTKNLFEKFDSDNSGSLDCQELTDLYHKNHINITERDI